MIVIVMLIKHDGVAEIYRYEKKEDGVTRVETFTHTHIIRSFSSLVLSSGTCINTTRTATHQDTTRYYKILLLILPTPTRLLGYLLPDLTIPGCRMRASGVNHCYMSADY